MTNEEGFSRDDMQIRVVGICGSLREESHTRTAVRIALDGAGRLGADTSLIDLRDYELPLCDGREDENTYSDGVHRLRREVGTASGLILGTPEYHGGLSGVLKNAMDLMGFDEFQGKMVGLVGVSGGALGASNALATLRTIGRALHAWVIPEQALVAEAWKQLDAEGKLKDPGLEKRLMEVGEQVARYTFLLHSDQASPDYAKTVVRC